MARNLMICTNAVNSLHKLNESENAGGQTSYVLEGIFAELDKLNRNQRIYPKDEYLKHLQYLRNDIKSGEPLLGELDHPEDRFEVKLKEASHEVIDLWYDEAKNVVMGKIRLLDTPNGKLAQSIVDQGIPLHISSRAAGTVNSDNTVSIQQIYTYDLVCKPGFAGAVLHRVNESADAVNYTDPVKAFLNKSIKIESMNAAPQYGFVNEDMSVSEIKANTVLRKEAKDIEINKQIEIDIKDMTNPILENANPDATVGKPLDISGNGAAALGIPTTTSETADVADEVKDDKKSESCSDKKESCDGDNCKDKKDVSEEDNNDEPKDDDKKDDEEKKDDKSEDSSEVEIIDVKGEFDDENIVDIKGDYGDDSEKSDDENNDKNSDGSNEDSSAEGDSNEDKRTPDVKDSNKDSAEMLNDKKDDEKDSEKKGEKDEKAEKEQEELDKANKDAEDEMKELQDHKEELNKKLDDILTAIKEKNESKEKSKCESIIMAQYPVSMMMNESNFAEFTGLNESQKSKVVAYLQDNNITDKKSINESWKNGINYTAEVPAWLKYAPENYKTLYESASDRVKQSLATTASYLIFESQYDINTFWENSGLTETNERRLLNESFINNCPKVNVQKEQPTDLPYGNQFIQQIADMASAYNKKY